MAEPLSSSTPNGSKAVPLFYEKTGLTSSPASKENPNQKMLVPFPFITHQALLLIFRWISASIGHGRRSIRLSKSLIGSRALG
jgi:hypothetical protein